MCVSGSRWVDPPLLKSTTTTKNKHNHPTEKELFLGRTRQGSDPHFHSGEALRAAVLSKPRPLDGYLLASSATPSAAAASAAVAATKASSSLSLSGAVIPLTEVVS